MLIRAPTDKLDSAKYRFAMKKTSLIAVALIVIATSLSASAFGAVKVGEPCKKAGVTSINLGKKLTCIKVGKKLVWKKRVAVTKPAAEPKPL